MVFVKATNLGVTHSFVPLSHISWAPGRWFDEVERTKVKASPSANLRSTTGPSYLTSLSRVFTCKMRTFMISIVEGGGEGT